MPADELADTSASVDDQERFLDRADIEVVGRMPWSSNATFLVELADGIAKQRGIYKPVAGERPLWDFAAGLDRRERAAFVLSEHLGLGVVPTTVLRDGPFGEGSVQWFVDADHSEHYFTLLESHPELHDQFRQLAAFDAIINNTDRKSGHVLFAEGRAWAIDNGLSFSVEDKLRTVIWDFAGEPIDEELLSIVAGLVEELPRSLQDLITDEEGQALQKRCGKLLVTRSLPFDRTGRGYPWPLV